jgi:hypothetical protein
MVKWFDHAGRRHSTEPEQLQTTEAAFPWLNGGQVHMAKKRHHFPVRPRGDVPGLLDETPVLPEDGSRPGARFYRAEYLTAFRHLEKHEGVNLASVLELGRQAQGWLTGEVGRVWDRAEVPRVACQENCAWCCSLAVSAWPLELLALASWLEACRSPHQLAELRVRLRAAVFEGDRQLASAPSRARRVACPLLAGEKCSAYEVRPAACVGWNSASASTCQAYSEGDDGIHCTVEPLRFFSARAVSEAAAAAVADCGGPAFDRSGNGQGGPVDLSSGLLAVIELGAAGAAQAWLAGSPFLAAARDRMERPPPFTPQDAG